MLHDRIKNRRLELKMSQDELAQKTGYKTKSAISRIESGTRDITQSQIKLFAKALQTTPSYLMGWDEESSNNTTKEEQKILEPYNKLNPAGKEKAVSYAWDLVDSNKYITIDRQKMISFLTNAELAALNGEINLETMTDDELYTLYSALKEED